ncbi:hypothetical protein O181_104924 [Austropuccinia psidii MF-1]|uniref:Uncharacterized protein n=1 Tax=Austropuccinia psidii MF-1 TaxID=1389203 RepID=A0A9Q3JP74_9BASI|nr:hypothetical protein [Austropuccinia psidii MF-1]
MYDLQPFELSVITDRVAFEHSCRQNDLSIVLSADKQKQKKTSKPINQQDDTSNGKKQNNNKSKKEGVINRNYSNSSQSNTSDANKRLDSLEKLMNKLQSTLKFSSVNVTDTPPINQTPASDSDAFMINCYHSLAEKTKENDIISLESGAEKTVVKDLSLLVNPVRVNKKNQCFLFTGNC